nr:aminoglycoside phosphotransferase family protein [Streptomyces paludis]
MGRQLDAGERIVRTETLHGGITAEIRRLTVRRQDGSTRDLVLRTFAAPAFVAQAEDLLTRESGVLALLAGTGVPAPDPIAVDATATHCEYPSLLMTHMPGRTVYDDEGLEARITLLARQLVAIHALRPAERPREYEAWASADTVVPPEGADPVAWAAAAEVIREPPPPYEGRFLHRDFHPGNILFETPGGSLHGATAPRITGIVDWVETSWGPADLDVAHCSTNLALLHGPAWAPRFAAAYEAAGGVLAAAPGERRYWRLLDALSFASIGALVVEPWRRSGRTDLTARTVEQRLDAYVTALLDDVRDED